MYSTLQLVFRVTGLQPLPSFGKKSTYIIVRVGSLADFPRHSFLFPTAGRRHETTRIHTCRFGFMKRENIMWFRKTSG